MIIVHFGVQEDGIVRPLCNDWGKSKSWTILPLAVTCPRCLERMRGGAQPPDGSVR